MFKSKTLFVLGAGASHEANLPLGSGLKTQIARLLDLRSGPGYELVSGDYRILEALKAFAQKNGFDANQLVRACWFIRDAMPQAISIDNFLETHQDDPKIQLCGKLGIALSILEAEENSLLAVKDANTGSPKLDHSSLAPTWYSKLFQRMHEGVTKGSVERIFHNTSFISFNYDRSLEHYLFFSLRNYYGVADDDVQKLMQSFRIKHPYGQCGHLPWQDRQEGIAFGQRVGGQRLLDIAEQIRTFNERVSDEESLALIRSEIESCEKVVFLGFAYHPINMELLQCSRRPGKVIVFGSAFGMSNKDCDVVARVITETLARQADRTYLELRNDLTCSDMFEQYSRSLAE